jgi:hypothetical protein
VSGAASSLSHTDNVLFSVLFLNPQPLNFQKKTVSGYYKGGKKL